MKTFGIVVLSLCVAAPVFDQTEPVKPQTDTIQIQIPDRTDQRPDRDRTGSSDGRVFQFNIDGNTLDSILKGINIDFPGKVQNETLVVKGRHFVVPSPAEWPVATTERKGIVKFGGNVVVGRNEIVNGDVVVFFGDAMIYGTVRGGVVVILGDIKLTSTSSVEKDLFCIWGNAEAAPGAHIFGTTNIFNFGKLLEKSVHTRTIDAIFGAMRFLRVLLLFAVAFILQAAFQKPVHLIHDKLRNQYPKSLVMGMLAILSLPIVIVLLLITIIGIPVALLALPLVILAAFLMGATAMMFWIGRDIGKRLGIRNLSVVLTLVIGVIGLEWPSLLYQVVKPWGGFLGTVFAVLGVLIFFAAWVPGFGAVILTRFGTKT